MQKLALFFFLFLFASSMNAQEVGSLLHYQKKGTNCLALAGEKYDDSKFNIIVGKDAYSGGTIRVKFIEESGFKAKKALFMFGENTYLSTAFIVKGKKNILAFENWVSGKIAKDPQGNSTMRVINGQSVTYSHVLKGRKLYINILSVD